MKLRMTENEASKVDYDVTFEQTDGSVNKKILSASSIDDIIDYMNNLPEVKEVISITKRSSKNNSYAFESLHETFGINHLTHNLVLNKDYWYDSVDNLESDEELEMFTDLGFVKGNDIIIPAGTKLKYAGSSNASGFLYFDVVGKGYTIAINNQKEMLNDFINCVDVIEVNRHRQ